MSAQSASRGVRVAFLLGVLAAGLVLVLSSAASAATITVANNNDNGMGSLRQAIADAASGDTIIVPAFTITLSSELDIADKSITITGAGASKTLVLGGGVTRVFETSGATSKITIKGLTIGDGNVTGGPEPSEGGGLEDDDATVTLANDVINGDSVTGQGSSGELPEAMGGGVFNNSGTVILRDTQVSGDLALADGSFGQPGGVALGGGVVSLGPLIVSGSTFFDNQADARGGPGTPSAAQAGGTAGGGGLWFQGGAISKSTFEGNSVDASGNGGKGGTAEGGGAVVAVDGPPGSVVNATFTMNVARSTNGGSTFGGGLYDFNDTGAKAVGVANSTVSDNTATGAGTGSNRGGNVFLKNVAVENTIINGGTGDPGAGNCAGKFTSLGHNIDSVNDCGFHAAGDRINTNPLLGPLKDNGGPAPTMALKPGSPAIDAGSNTGCPNTDERGVLRPAGKACDIGAFEVATPGATTGRVRANTLTGTAFNPNLAAGTAHFEYGKTTSYGATTTPETVAALTRRQPVRAPLPKLSPGIYHFRLVVTNSVRTVNGKDRTFKIAPELTSLMVQPHGGKHPRVTYDDTAAATTAFVLEQRIDGQWMRIAKRFTHHDTTGTNTFTLKRDLGPGRYRLKATPRENGVTGNTLIAAFGVA